MSRARAAPGLSKAKSFAPVHREPGVQQYAAREAFTAGPVPDRDDPSRSLRTAVGMTRARLDLAVRAGSRAMAVSLHLRGLLERARAPRSAFSVGDLLARGCGAAGSAARRVDRSWQSIRRRRSAARRPSLMVTGTSLGLQAASGPRGDPIGVMAAFGVGYGLATMAAAVLAASAPAGGGGAGRSASTTWRRRSRWPWRRRSASGSFARSAPAQTSRW